MRSQAELLEKWVGADGEAPSRPGKGFDFLNKRFLKGLFSKMCAGKSEM